ncbi:uncharacterized protein LOC125327704 [Corvus hawaiiensis]|uniref:uncharacterized protein LOC125327704 n=1 Tax=Corvus hawaiiensis TaxID=134902 RepID=UPI0020187DA1|nr:uncharacterized protein LOC125327704 [Corvus hawaiiensis]
MVSDGNSPGNEVKPDSSSQGQVSEVVHLQDVLALDAGGCKPKVLLPPWACQGPEVSRFVLATSRVRSRFEVSRGSGVEYPGDALVEGNSDVFYFVVLGTVSRCGAEAWREQLPERTVGNVLTFVVPKADSHPCSHRCYRFSQNLPFQVMEQQLEDVLMCLCQWSVDEEARPAEEEDEEVCEDGDSGHQRLGKAQIQLLLEFEHNLFLSRSPASLGQDLSQSLLGPGSERLAANGAGEFLGALWVTGEPGTGPEPELVGPWQREASSKWCWRVFGSAVAQGQAGEKVERVASGSPMFRSAFGFQFLPGGLCCSKYKGRRCWSTCLFPCGAWKRC